MPNVASRPTPTLAALKRPGSASNLELLQLVGDTVFGIFWQKPMVEYLGMSQRHMVRWCNGQWEVPSVLQEGRSLAVVLKDLLEDHQKRVDAVRIRVIAALPDGGRRGT
jgi:hypothetical protein